jgi:hypothetical protein
LPNRGNGQIEAEQIATVFGSKQNYFEREEYIIIRDEYKIDRIKEDLATLKQQKAEESFLLELTITIMNSLNYLINNIK